MKFQDERGLFQSLVKTLAWAGYSAAHERSPTQTFF